MLRRIAGSMKSSPHHTPLVHVNGTPVENAHLLVAWDDLTFSRGHGVFETLPVFAHRPVALHAHLVRLEHSCTLMGIHPPAALRRQVEQLLAVNPYPHATLRIQVTHSGQSVIGVRPAGPRRIHASVKRLVWTTPPFPPARAKHTSRAGFTLAPGTHGVDEIIRTTPRGHALEGTWSSVFCLRAGRLRTCPDDGRILAGITRAQVIAIAAELQIPVIQRAPGPPRSGDAWFLTSSLQGVVPMSILDGVQQPPLPPVVRALRTALDQQTGRPPAVSE